MELEDADFIKMVEELRIDYDELDLKEVEKEVKSKLLSKKGPVGIWIICLIIKLFSFKKTISKFKLNLLR